MAGRGLDDRPPPAAVRSAVHCAGELGLVAREFLFSSEPFNGWLSTESAVCRWSRSRVILRDRPLDPLCDHPTRRVTSPGFCRSPSSNLGEVISWTAAAMTARRASDPEWDGRVTDPASAALDRESPAPLPAAVRRDVGLELCGIPRSIRRGRRRMSPDRGVVFSCDAPAFLNLLESAVVAVVEAIVGVSSSLAVIGTEKVCWTRRRVDACCVTGGDG